jgi:hypothetical protein
MNQPAKEIISGLLYEKSKLKQDIFYLTIDVFKQLKEVVRESVAELKPLAQNIDKRIIIDYKDKSEHEIELRVAGDVMIFSMHTNVFEFDQNHPMWRTSYIKQDHKRSYCGMIMVYNFLADTFKYNRMNDVGYLVSRLFVNHERHYFAEGKRQLGLLFNNFASSEISKEELKKFVEATVIYCLDFDLFTPPFDDVKMVSFAQIQEESSMMSLKTGKRLGFRFQADTDLD